MLPRDPPRTAFLNARLIDPGSGLDEPGQLLAEAGAIADFGPRLFNDGLPDGCIEIDCQGHCLMPGLVDMRVELGEPGNEHKETFTSGSEAAVAGGVTSMVALPNTEPVVDDVAGVEFVARRAREEKLAKIYTYAAVTVGLGGKEMTEIGLLKEYGAVGFTDGHQAVASAQVMQRALSYAGTFGAVIVQHPAEPSLSGGLMNSGELATRLGLSGISPLVEVMMVERDLRLVEMTGGRYHVSHVSARETVEVIRRAKARGLEVTCDTAPHYFMLNELAVNDYRTFAKVSPPLRSEDDRLAIIEGLADGTIDAIASDHSPHDQDSKRLPFAMAAFGVVGLETLLPLSLGLVHNGALDLHSLLAKLTCKPAAILDLPAGRIAKGEPADLIVLDPEKPWRIVADDLRSKSKNSAFDGHLVQGRVLRTMVDGRTAFDFNGQAAPARELVGA